MTEGPGQKQFRLLPISPESPCSLQRSVVPYLWNQHVPSGHPDGSIAPLAA